MCRLRFIEPQEVSPSTKAIFKKLGLVPNLLCIMANSDAAMASFADYTEHQERYKLSKKHRKMISLAVSQFNDCDYCIALHTADAVDGGVLSREECLDARRMNSPHPQENALLKLVGEVLVKRGHVDDETIAEARRNGFDDQDIIEMINIIGVINIANYTANVARPELDFLEPPPLED
jgi:uncharacterized peroxidase-related enzyme